MAGLVTTHLLSSLDGVVESPNLWLFHSFDSFDDQLGELMVRRSPAPTPSCWDARRTTRGQGSGPPCRLMTRSRGSSTRCRSTSRRGPSGPGDLTWQNSHLIEGDLTASVARLAQGEGGDIAVNGSISVVRQIFDAGVLDRLTLTIHPVVAGTGRRLFEPGDDTTRLALIDQITTPAGNLVATSTRSD
jgi:hypothetical protein